MVNAKPPWIPPVTPLERAANIQGTGRLAFVRPAAALDNSRLIDREEAECFCGLEAHDFDAAIQDGLIPSPRVFLIGGRKITRWQRGELLKAVHRLGVRTGTGGRKRASRECTEVGHE